MTSCKQLQIFSKLFLSFSGVSNIFIILFTFFGAQLAYAQLDKNTWFFGGAIENTRPGIQFDFTTNQPSQYNEVRYPLDLSENNVIISNSSTGEVIKRSFQT